MNSLRNKISTNTKNQTTALENLLFCCGNATLTKESVTLKVHNKVVWPLLGRNYTQTGFTKVAAKVAHFGNSALVGEQPLFFTFHDCPVAPRPTFVVVMQLIEERLASSKLKHKKTTINSVSFVHIGPRIGQQCAQHDW